MTTSNNIAWELDRDELITRAYAKIGIPGEDNTLSATQIADGAENLNAVIALAVTDGMPLWKRLTEVLTPSTTNQVYTISGAVKIAQVTLRDSGGVQYDLRVKSLYDFNRLPFGTTGTPVHYTFQPTLTGGTLSVWPTYSDTSVVSSKTIRVTYQKEFDGFTAASETLDMPSYWTLPIVYKLAVLLAPEHGVPLNDRNALKAEAKEYWDMAKGYGDEDGSFFIQPARNK